MRSLKPIFISIFSSILVFILCSLLSPPSHEINQFSFIPGFLSKAKLSEGPPTHRFKRLLQNNGVHTSPRQLQGPPSPPPNNDPTLIGTLDTFDQDPKFVKLDIFDNTVKDHMVLKCYSDATCSFSQSISIEDFIYYTPQTETFYAPRLPDIYNALSFYNVLFVENSENFTSYIVDALTELEYLVQGYDNLKNTLTNKIQDFIDDTEVMITSQMSQVSEQVLAELDDLNSDLSLQFQNLLANSFSIVVGLFLQQISSDYLFFKEQIIAVKSAIETDISLNTVAISNFSNQTQILENIDIVELEYSDLCQGFIDQLNNYQLIETNWSSIISDQIQQQIINKFTFANLTVQLKVQQFLLLIIQHRRNLIDQTGSLIFQSFQLYQSSLANDVQSNNHTIQAELEAFKNKLISNSIPSTNETINSIFEQEELRNALFSIFHEINALESLTDITTVQFADVLQQFQNLFIQLSSNLNDILAAILDIFEGNFTILVNEINELTQEVDQNATIFIQKFSQAIRTGDAILDDTYYKLLNYSYQLNDQELSLFQQYNIFNDSIIPNLQQIDKQFINIDYNIFTAIYSYYSDFQTVVTFNFSSIIPAEIKNNITDLINSVIAHEQTENQTLTNLTEDAENVLGLNATDNFSIFLDEFDEYIELPVLITIEVLQALLTNDFINFQYTPSILIPYLEAKFQGVFNESFNDSLGGPFEFSDQINKTYVNVSDDDMESHLKSTFNYYHLIQGYYGVEKTDDNFTHFYFKIIPYVDVNVKIVDVLREIYLLREVLKTNVDFLNGTLPISYDLIGKVNVNGKTIAKYIHEDIYMNTLYLTIQDLLEVFLRHDSAGGDPSNSWSVQVDNPAIIIGLSITDD